MALKGKTRNRLRRAVQGGLSRLRKPARQKSAAPSQQANEPERSVVEDQHHQGSHQLDPHSWQLPAGLAEAGEAEERGLRPGPLVTTIIICALLFILLIAVLASRMPQPAQ